MEREKCGRRSPEYHAQRCGSSDAWAYLDRRGLRAARCHACAARASAFRPSTVPALSVVSVVVLQVVRLVLRHLTCRWVGESGPPARCGRPRQARGPASTGRGGPCQDWRARSGGAAERRARHRRLGLDGVPACARVRAGLPGRDAKVVQTHDATHAQKGRRGGQECGSHPSSPASRSSWVLSLAACRWH
jgi:hypothetical protein